MQTHIDRRPERWSHRLSPNRCVDYLTDSQHHEGENLSIIENTNEGFLSALAADMDGGFSLPWRGHESAVAFADATSVV